MAGRTVAAALLVAATVALAGAHASTTADVRLYLKSTGYYGAVDVSPSGTQIGDCSTYCTLSFPRGTPVTLTAQRGYGSFQGWTQLFTNWPAACTGAQPLCSLTLNSSAAAKAVFNPSAVRVLAGDGGWAEIPNGTVSCGSGCRLFNYGAVAELRAHAYEGNAFSYWSGGCANIGPACNVVVRDNRLLGANFHCTESICHITQPLTTTVRFWVRVTGPGSVVGPSINCPGASCSRDLDVGQQMSLQAVPATGASLVGWYGRGFRCSTSATRCTFKATKSSRSDLPGLVVSFR